MIAFDGRGSYVLLILFELINYKTLSPSIVIIENPLNLNIFGIIG